MENDKSLRILQDNVDLEKIFSKEFIEKLKKNFDGVKIFPIAVAFAIDENDVSNDNISILYRNDEELDKKTVLIDVSNNPAYMKKIIDSLEV